jgi:hypothetical protein
MNYIAEVNAFERWLETNYLPSLAQLLWYKLIMLCNKAGWCEWVTVDNQRLMALIQLKREATFIELRNKLIDAGLIEYRKGKKGSPNQYKINTFNLKVETEVQTVVNTVVETEVQTVDIYKLNKTKPIRKNVKKEFTPPTLDEVRKYVLDKKLKVNAERFFNYFAESNWVDSKGNKVKNWKQKILTWDSFSKKEEKSSGTSNSYHAENQYSNLDGFYMN